MNALLKQVLEPSPLPTSKDDFRQPLVPRRRIIVKEETKKPTIKDSDKVAVIARARGVELFPANDAPQPPRPPSNIRKQFIRKGGKGLFN